MQNKLLSSVLTMELCLKPLAIIVLSLWTDFYLIIGTVAMSTVSLLVAVNFKMISDPTQDDYLYLL